jgi:hypothetical protein
MAIPGEYNPLDYANLTKHCVQELMVRRPVKLGDLKEFPGAGVYALFYTGKLPFYAKVCSPDAQWPIYVGKAVPEGARKGGKKPKASKGGNGKRVVAASSGRTVEEAPPGKELYGRLCDHAKSIGAAKSTLSLDDFLVRYLVVTPVWITMAERFLIEYFKPAWNHLIEGFGNHDPGSGRYNGMISWWDVLHPGREWALKLKQGRTRPEALALLADFMKDYEPRPGASLFSEETPSVEVVDPATPTSGEGAEEGDEDEGS